MESLGKYLKKIRKERGVSLESLSSKTRIRENYLRALEEDQLERVPNQVFAKGFVRSYIKAFSLNEADVLKRYEEEILSYFKQKEPFCQESEPKTTEVAETRPHKRVAGGLAVIFVGVGLVALWVFFPDRTDLNPDNVSNQTPLKQVNYLSQNPEQPIDIQEDSLEGAIGPEPRGESLEKSGHLELKTNSGVPEANLPTNRKVGISPPALFSTFPELMLNIKALERSWMYVTIDDIKSREMILEKGERFHLEAKEKFLITLGNSGGVVLELNNTPIDISGESGRVKRDILLTKETLKAIKNKENFSVKEY